MARFASLVLALTLLPLPSEAIASLEDSSTDPGIGLPEIPIPEPTVCESRSFRIPFITGVGVKSVLLFFSRDRGETWHFAGRANGNQKWFRFSAPAAGLYCFRLQAVLADGSKDPPAIRRGGVDLAVVVETDK